MTKAVDCLPLLYLEVLQVPLMLPNPESEFAERERELTAGPGFAALEFALKAESDSAELSYRVCWQQQYFGLWSDLLSLLPLLSSSALGQLV
jgi:hypothetical protein